mgnify:CR=1 FL=1
MYQCPSSASDKGYTTPISDVTLSVIEGDITKQTTHCIVNSVLKSLNLSAGQVSQAILRAAGPILQKECATSGRFTCI